MLEKKTNKLFLLLGAITLTLLLLFLGKTFFNISDELGPWLLLVITVILFAGASGSLHLYHKNFLSRYLQAALISGSCALVTSLLLISHLA